MTQGLNCSGRERIFRFSQALASVSYTASAASSTSLRYDMLTRYISFSIRLTSA